MRSKRLTLLATAAVLALGAAPAAFAQDLRALYEAARAYDATFLAAQAQARSAEFRAAQADALTRPSAALSAGANAGYVNADGRPGATATRSTPRCRAATRCSTAATPPASPRRSRRCACRPPNWPPRNRT